MAQSAPRLAALLIAATLGLLSPLSCVIHCAIHGAPRHDNHALAAPAGRPTPGGEEPITPLTPRAFYEFVSLGSLLLVTAGLLVAVLLLPPRATLRPFVLSPPTPPPRLLAR